jgi:hypothetical protein
MSIFDGAVKGDKFEARDGGVWEFVSLYDGGCQDYYCVLKTGDGATEFTRSGRWWSDQTESKEDIIRKLPKQQTAKPNKKMDLAITRHPKHEGWVCSPEFCDSETVFTADELFDLAREINLVEKALDVLNGESDA